MEVTREAILELLVEGEGKVRNSDLLGSFRSCLNCPDPAEKKLNRDLFKGLVNDLAVVKEIDGAKCIVLRKKFHRLLAGHRPSVEEGSGGEEGESPGGGASQGRSTSGQCDEATPRSPEPALTVVELALQRSTSVDVRLRAKNFKIAHNSSDPDASGDGSTGYDVNKSHSTRAHSKPYALPLRMPPGGPRVETHKLKGGPERAPGKLPTLPDVNQGRPSSEGVGRHRLAADSPPPTGAPKNAKPSEEPKEPRFTSAAPLEPSEHEWLVKSAAGYWGQVYGLLLRDNQLVEKRDFMSGFTALHWAAKWGNGDMLAKMIQISRDGGVDVDINAKTHGGYTPLHIAALHDQEMILAMLVSEYGVDTNVRDNCGKKAYHYLHTGVSQGVRELLGEPKAQGEEQEPLPDLAKGLHTISRLFQPHVSGHKKKHKHRSEFGSLTEDPGEEREESRLKHRAASDALM